MAAEDGGSVVTGEGQSTAPKKPAGTVRKPHTLDQVVEAITQNSDRKGVTVAAIKNHLAVGVLYVLVILRYYCSVRPLLK